MPRVLDRIAKVIGVVVRAFTRLTGIGRQQGHADSAAGHVMTERPGPPAAAGQANVDPGPPGMGAPWAPPAQWSPWGPAPGMRHAMPDGPAYLPSPPQPVLDSRAVRLRQVGGDIDRQSVSEPIRRDERTLLAAMVRDPSLRDELLLAFPPGAYSPEARSAFNVIGALHRNDPAAPIDVDRLEASLAGVEPRLSADEVRELGTGAAPTGMATSAAVRAIKYDIFDERSSREERSRGLSGEIDPALHPEEQHRAESNQWWSTISGVESDLGLPPGLAHIQVAYTDDLQWQWMAHMATGDTLPAVGRQKAFEELPIWDRMAANEAWAAKSAAAAEPNPAVAVAADVLAGPEQGQRTANTGTANPAPGGPRQVRRDTGRPGQQYAAAR